MSSNRSNNDAQQSISIPLTFFDTKSGKTISYESFAPIGESFKMTISYSSRNPINPNLGSKNRTEEWLRQSATIKHISTPFNCKLFMMTDGEEEEDYCVMGKGECYVEDESKLIDLDVISVLEDLINQKLLSEISEFSVLLKPIPSNSST
ncbi:uncharacterized protein L201_007837 [Kwoniella dendrophila CBS 6074]|uniref:Uncharacterized protein n=1 Tax=Kwoniella dendrophila CBS 6074 TaxID=1295534 RepID=A0AAX4K5M1_9TREE